MEDCYLKIFNSKFGNQHSYFYYNNSYQHNYHRNRPLQCHRQLIQKFNHFNNYRVLNIHINNNKRNYYNSNKISNTKIISNGRQRNCNYHPRLRYMDHIYCHNASQPSKASSADSSMGRATGILAKTESGHNSAKAHDIPHLKHSHLYQQQHQQRYQNSQQLLTNLLKENKQLKAMIIFHLDLIQEQNNQLLAKDKILVTQIDELEHLVSRNNYLENHVRELQRQLQQQIKRTGEISSLPPPPLAKIQCKITTCSTIRAPFSTHNTNNTTIFTTCAITNTTRHSGYTPPAVNSPRCIQEQLTCPFSNLPIGSTTISSSSTGASLICYSQIPFCGGEQRQLSSEVLVSNEKPNIIGECNGKLIRKIILQRVDGPIQNFASFHNVDNLYDEKIDLQSPTSESSGESNENEKEENEDEVDEVEEEKRGYELVDTDCEKGAVDTDIVTDDFEFPKIKGDNVGTALVSNINLKNKQNTTYSRRQISEYNSQDMVNAYSLKAIAASTLLECNDVDQEEVINRNSKDGKETLAPVQCKRLKERHSIIVPPTNIVEANFLKKNASIGDHKCNPLQEQLLSTSERSLFRDSLEIPVHCMKPTNKEKQSPSIDWQTTELQTDESVASCESDNVGHVSISRNN